MEVCWTSHQADQSCEGVLNRRDTSLSPFKMNRLAFSIQTLTLLLFHIAITFMCYFTMYVHQSFIMFFTISLFINCLFMPLFRPPVLPPLASVARSCWLSLLLVSPGSVQCQWGCTQPSSLSSTSRAHPWFWCQRNQGPSTWFRFDGFYFSALLRSSSSLSTSRLHRTSTLNFIEERKKTL
jgi:hypothetical protein